MPYLVNLAVPVSRMLSIEFEPQIDERSFAKLELGLDVTEDEVFSLPKTLLVDRGKNGPLRGDFPHYLGPPFGPFFVSDRVKDILEEMEPGAHGYASMQVRSKDGRKIKGEIDHGLFHFVIRYPKLEAVVIEKTEFDSGFGREGFKAVSSPTIAGMGHPCVLDPKVTRGHHFWQLKEPFQGIHFFSDELHDRLKSENLGGFNVIMKCTFDNE